MFWVILLGGAFLVGALLYWQLSLAEGVYLGRRVVVWLYDRFAPRYDVTKQFSARDEARFLGQPLAQALANMGAPLVLDVATGTARLPLALCRQPDFAGRVIALDLSRQMLRRAAANLAAHRDRVTLLWQDASRLPFTDQVFDAVTCLEALEFVPDARAALAEMVRVLRPGGVLLLSNRIGSGARWLPRRTLSSRDFAALLESAGLEQVQVRAWQVDYDLLWARKRSTELLSGPGQAMQAAPATLPALLQCPHCADGALTRHDHAFICVSCDSRYPIAEDDVVELSW